MSYYNLKPRRSWTTSTNPVFRMSRLLCGTSWKIDSFRFMAIGRWFRSTPLDPSCFITELSARKNFLNYSLNADYCESLRQEVSSASNLFTIFLRRSQHGAVDRARRGTQKREFEKSCV